MKTPYIRWEDKSRLTPAGQLKNAPDLRTLEEARETRRLTRDQVIAGQDLALYFSRKPGLE